MLLTGLWTRLTNRAPSGITTMMLLTDGTVMAQNNGGNAWYQLTPDYSGSYIDGSWGALSSMIDTRLYYPSAVLYTGQVFVAGGEYGSGTSHAELYDPPSDTWTALPSRPLGDIGDIPSAVLPDGRVLVGYRADGRTNIFDPSTNTWSAGPTKLRNSRSDEESWVTLPDQSVLTVEVFNSPHAQKYIPADNTWVDAGTLPFDITEGSEIGPGFMLPDGRVFFVGASGRTAFYNIPNDPHLPGSWTAGPALPANHGAWDVPGAVMPNGEVLLAVGPHSYNGPTTFYEFDPTTNTYANVTAPPGSSGPPYSGRMLVLPSGQILWSNSSNILYVYTPDGGPDPSWQPTISEVDDNGDGTFSLYGTQLTGLDEGAAYGDDAEMSSNYPIVQLSDGFGDVYYARTSYWNYVGVATGNYPESTYFTLPAGIPAGDYSLSVIANGIASDPVDFVVGGTGPIGNPAPIRIGGTTLAQPSSVDLHTIGGFTPSPQGADLALAVANLGDNHFLATSNDSSASAVASTSAMGQELTLAIYQSEWGKWLASSGEPRQDDGASGLVALIEARGSTPSDAAAIDSLFAGDLASW